MPAYIDQLLREFVDRENEMERFRRLLDDSTRSIMVIWGGGGVGKSSLLAKITHEIAQRRLAKAEVVWTESRNHDYMAVMRKIRDDFGVEIFHSFTDLVNYFTVPEYKLTINVAGGGGVSAGSGLTLLGGSQTGDVGGIIVKDFMLTDPRADKDIPETERRTRLTDTFLPCLLAAARLCPCVILLDATEKMTAETEAWLWQDFLAGIRDADCTSLKVVVCGRKEPPIDRTWRQSAEIRQLKPLTEEHIVEYLQKRGIEEARAELARMLLITTRGNMFDLATAVDAYLEDVE